MTMKFKGGSPKNARIKIDYSGVKPNVSFSYPDKKNQGGGSMLMYIFMVFVLLGLGYYYSVDYETLSSYQKVGILIILPLIATCLVYYPFKKYWANVFPNFQAATATKKKYRKFLSKDVQKNKDYYVEIPLFKNILLDYKATKDFSKYLEFFEIREHNFKCVRWDYIKNKRKFDFMSKDVKMNKKLIEKRKRRKRKSELNESLWYAKFYFSKKPKNGQLEVLFK